MTHTHPINQPIRNLAVPAARVLPPSRFLGPLMPENDGPNWINCVAWSPDASVVVTGTGDNYDGNQLAGVWFWDAHTGQALAQITNPVGPIKPGQDFAPATTHVGRVNGLAWHPNGQWLAAAHGNRCTVWVPDPLAFGTTRDRWQRTGEPRSLFSAELARAPDPIRWDDYSAGPPESLDTRWSRWPDVFTVDWSPDGKFLVGACADHQVRVWDVASGQLDSLLIGHSESVRSAYVHPQGTWILTASTDHTVRIWDRASGACRHILRGGPDVALNEAIWSPDGQVVLATYADTTVASWTDWQAEDAAPQLYSGGWYARWSPDGRWVAVSVQGHNQIWDATLQKCAWELLETSPRHDSWGAIDLAWRSDSGAVVGGGTHGVTAVWELDDLAAP